MDGLEELGRETRGDFELIHEGMCSSKPEDMILIKSVGSEASTPERPQDETIDLNDWCGIVLRQPEWLLRDLLRTLVHPGSRDGSTI